jgi:hypothetical protein
VIGGWKAGKCVLMGRVGGGHGRGAWLIVYEGMGREG